MTQARCRSCGAALHSTFADLGVSPLANSYVEAADLNRSEAFYPLHAYVCTACFLVQVEPMESSARIFSEYAYFSSYSDTWLAHSRAYVDHIVPRLGLGPGSMVVELASNDGYLLQYVQERGIPVLGVEPARNVAQTAIERGIPTRAEFFGASFAGTLTSEGVAADLVVANNVIAHVPDVHDFVEGMRLLLRPDGTATIEFPHLLRMIEETQYDTIYHEHFSYFSLLSIEPIFARHGLRVYDVERLSTHGGSLRLFVGHHDRWRESEAVQALRNEEARAGLHHAATYAAFADSVRRNKRNLLRFLLDCADSGKSVVAYGAPAKGNTMLNYCGVRTDLLAYTVDRSPAKQGRYLPGVRIPIYAPEKLRETKPDVVLILPWNLKDEIVGQIAWIREWGGTFAVAVPTLAVIE